MKPSSVVLLVLLGFISCKKDEPTQPHVTAIQLSVEDVSCTEAWLRVSLTDASGPRTVALQQDGHTVLAARLFGADSLLVVEGLLPHRTYSFAAERLSDTTAIDVTAPVQMTTMDTTSHNITWDRYHSESQANPVEAAR